MALTDFLDRFAQSRRALKALDRIAAAHESSAVSLRRLADRWAPEPLPDPPQEHLAQTIPAYGRDGEFARIESRQIGVDYFACAHAGAMV